MPRRRRESSPTARHDGGAVVTPPARPSASWARPCRPRSMPLIADAAASRWLARRCHAAALASELGSGAGARQGRPSSVVSMRCLRRAGGVKASGHASGLRELDEREPPRWGSRGGRRDARSGFASAARGGERGGAADEIAALQGMARCVVSPDSISRPAPTPVVLEPVRAAATHAAEGVLLRPRGRRVLKRTTDDTLPFTHSLPLPALSLSLSLSSARSLSRERTLSLSLSLSLLSLSLSFSSLSPLSLSRSLPLSLDSLSLSSFSPSVPLCGLSRVSLSLSLPPSLLSISSLSPFSPPSLSLSPSPRLLPPPLSPHVDQAGGAAARSQKARAGMTEVTLAGYILPTRGSPGDAQRSTRASKIERGPAGSTIDRMDCCGRCDEIAAALASDLLLCEQCATPHPSPPLLRRRLRRTFAAQPTLRPHTPAPARAVANRGGRAHQVLPFDLVLMGGMPLPMQERVIGERICTTPPWASLTGDPHVIGARLARCHHRHSADDYPSTARLVQRVPDHLRADHQGWPELMSCGLRSPGGFR